MFKKKVNLLLLALASTSAHAVIGGSNVSSSEYKDFMVYLEIGGEACAGSLLGGDYIVTARHCIMPISGASAGTLYGSTMTIKQGVTKSTATTYTRTFTYFTSEDYDSEKSTAASNVYSDVSSNYPVGGAFKNDITYVDDLVILKLSSSIPHRTGALISPIYDFNTNETLLPKNTDFTFRGWGYTDSAESTLADTMQKGTAQLFLDYIDPEGPSFVNSSKWGDVYDVCVDAVASGCQWYNRDFTPFYLTGSARLAPGDSGSPIYYDDQIFGVLSKTNTVNTFKSQMSDFTLLMDDIQSYINGYTYPSKAGVQISKGTTNSYSFTVPVQNFTASSTLFTPVVTDTTGLFDIDTTDCNATISSKKGCILSVTFNSANSQIDTDQSASVYLSPDVDITVSATIKTESSASASGGEGGGGSMSHFALLFLGIAGYLRRRFNI